MSVQFTITDSDVQIQNDVTDGIIAFAANANNTNMGFTLPGNHVLLSNLTHG